MGYRPGKTVSVKYFVRVHPNADSYAYAHTVMRMKCIVVRSIDKRLHCRVELHLIAITQLVFAALCYGEIFMLHARNDSCSQRIFIKLKSQALENSELVTSLISVYGLSHCRACVHSLHFPSFFELFRYLVC